MKLYFFSSLSFSKHLIKVFTIQESTFLEFFVLTFSIEETEAGRHLLCPFNAGSSRCNSLLACLHTASKIYFFNGADKRDSYERLPNCRGHKHKQYQAYVGYNCYHYNNCKSVVMKINHLFHN